MSESELRAAAERRRNNVYDSPTWPNDHDEYWMSSTKFDDMKLLADAYLAQHPAGGPWLDISAAPTNTAVLIYLPNCDHYGPGVYRAILCDMGTGRRWHTTAWACGRDLGGGVVPACWMPLPEPPKPDAPTPEAPPCP